MFRFEKLEIWQLAIEYGMDCYKIAEKLPAHEKFSLADQLRRAGISPANNIAEGSVDSPGFFRRHLRIAVASTLETVNIFIFALKVGYIDQKTKDNMYEKAEVLIRKTRSFSKTLQ